MFSDYIQHLKYRQKPNSFSRVLQSPFPNRIKIGFPNVLSLLFNHKGFQPIHKEAILDFPY